MAARKGNAKADDAEDVDEEGFEQAPPDEDLEETSLDEAFADEEESLDEDDLGAGPDLDEDPVELTAEPIAPGDVDDDPAPETASTDAAFDDEQDDEGIVAAVAGEENDLEIEGLRDGEFVCRSCYMAKRDTQLADPERLLCRDCA